MKNYYDFLGTEYNNYSDTIKNPLNIFDEL